MAAATDSGGETGYESNDSSTTLNHESPKSELEFSLDQKASSPISCFNFGSIPREFLEPPALSFLSVMPFDDQHYGVMPQEELCCKMLSGRAHNMRHAMRWKYVHGIIPKLKDMLDEKKLRIAANLNNIDVVRQLLDAGVDPRSADKRQRTALHFSVCKGYTEIVQLLLERGANPNQKDMVGNTPLHLATCTSNINVITLLLKYGASPKCMDNSGRSPLQLAQSKLRLLQVDRSCSSQELKNEASHVIYMLQTYLMKSGLDAEAQLLSAFQTRLNLSQSKEEADDNVRDLLSKLSDLSLKRT